MDKKIFMFTFSNSETEYCYFNKADAVMGLTEVFIKKITAYPTSEQLSEFKEMLKWLDTADKGDTYNSTFALIKIMGWEVKTDEVEKPVILDYKYVVSEGIPSSVHDTLDSAKSELLNIILDIYDKIPYSKETMLLLMFDIKTLIDNEEPYIEGCGQITKTNYKRK